MISEEVVVNISLLIAILFFYRYGILYSSRSAKIYLRINYMNKVLAKVDNPSSTKINFDDYKPEIKQLSSKDLIKPEYIQNKVYNNYYQQFIKIESYRRRFWKLEGKIYLGIVIILIILSIL